ncbi:MAG TPA: c-type cytochrome, partial [Polyangiaceae bacterium LLY-WYZ-15_(1-7)]|nr:c-type cytochrome [Polyangiaceae bacterium LLY-WYZ-15_(1-7)]
LRGEALLPRQEGLDSDTDNSGVPGFLDALAFTPDGARALLPALKANNVSGLFRTGEPFDSQTTARAVLVELFAAGAGDPSDGVEETFRVSFDDLDFGSALAITPVGDRLFVAMMGAQRVVALDAFSFDTLGSIADVGVAPRALALDEDAAGRERLWVFATLSRELRVYDVSELSREPPLLAAVPTLADEPLAPDVLRGKQLFHTSVDPRMSRTSYLSCASCHLDGESDGLVWDFTQRGEGLRNTIDLRGHGVGHGAIHWSGNFDEVQDFEGDIRNGQGGTGFLSEAHWAETAAPLGPPKAGLSEELDALAAYVASLTRVGTSPFRRDDGAFDLARARGAAVFADAGCAGCHAGEAFTDSAVGVRHDVGTLSEASGQRLGEALDGLDTPTLRGLWRTAPYLHDGSAPTLEAVFITRNPDDAHGATSDLSEAERADLLLYLRTLDDLE